ncbi:MAG: hypothetical protein EAZ52_01045 [Alphaproteobacteria bacterium]|nr:MAG: hypothetical protein EAZ52_01045 [Alphaproteobacteria bacterium]
MRIHPTCLILSTVRKGEEKIDGHIEPVVANMSSSSMPFICDYTRYGVDYTASLTNDGIITLQLYDGDEVYLDRLSTVWIRRPQGFPHHMLSRLEIAKYVYKEHVCFWVDALEFLMYQRDIYQYNHIHHERSIDNKYVQQHIARDVGLKTVPMIITSSKVDVEAFIAHYPDAIVKLQHTFSSDDVFWQPTKKFTHEMLDELSKLYVAPIIVQEYIDGVYDYRITMIDDHVIAARYHTGSSRYPYDVRIDRFMKAEQCTIDDATIRALQAFMRATHLRYAAFDFRENRHGEMIFLEVNPSGGFLYVDQDIGSDIAQIMADVLSATHRGKAHYDASIRNDAHRFDYDPNCLPFAASVGGNVEVIRR